MRAFCAGMIDIDALGTSLMLVLGEEEQLPPFLLSPLVPLMRMLISHTRVSQSLARSCAALILRLLGCLCTSLGSEPSSERSESASAESQSDLTEAVRLVAALRAVWEQNGLQLSAGGVSGHIAGRCAESITLLGDLVAGCPVLFASSPDLQPAISLLSSSPLLNCVNQLLEWPVCGPAVQEAVKEVDGIYRVVAAATAVRT
jgi:hypothetical protein